MYPYCKHSKGGGAETMLMRGWLASALGCMRGESTQSGRALPHLEVLGVIFGKFCSCCLPNLVQREHRLCRLWKGRERRKCSREVWCAGSPNSEALSTRHSQRLRERCDAPAQP